MREILEDLDVKSEDIDPVKKAQELSKRPLPKRFYEKAEIGKKDDQFNILLDKRAVKTPAKRDLILPTEQLGALIVAEFNAQTTFIDPAKMPITRMANTVVDGIADDMQAVFEDLLRFVSIDMVFYRAATPKELVDRQNENWDPILDWAAEKLGAQFLINEGVMHIVQPREAVLAVSNHLRKIVSPFTLAALHTLTTLTGSGLIALMLECGDLAYDDAWQLAHLDEDWTIEHWGSDEEAQQRRAYRREEFDAAIAILKACG